jgi:hypothetical protein
MPNSAIRCTPAATPGPCGPCQGVSPSDSGNRVCRAGAMRMATHCCFASRSALAQAAPPRSPATSSGPRHLTSLCRSTNWSDSLDCLRSFYGNGLHRVRSSPCLLQFPSPPPCHLVRRGPTAHPRLSPPIHCNEWTQRRVSTTVDMLRCESMTVSQALLKRIQTFE